MALHLPVLRRRSFAALGGALAAGLLVVSLLPIWNTASGFGWSVSPYTEYSRIYFPYQKLGFGVDPLPALRPLQQDMIGYDRTYRAIHGAHTVEDLPAAALGRALGIGREIWGAA